MRKSSNQSPRKEARPHQQKVSKKYPKPQKEVGLSAEMQRDHVERKVAMEERRIKLEEMRVKAQLLQAQNEADKIALKQNEIANHKLKIKHDKKRSEELILFIIGAFFAMFILGSIIRA